MSLQSTLPVLLSSTPNHSGSDPTPRHPVHRDDIAAELERHHAAAWGWALACCGRDTTEAEDVLHTAYLKLLDGRARYDGRSAFRTFLFGVLHRTASERRRRSAAQRLLLLRWGESVPRPAAADPGHDHFEADRRSRLKAALATLSPRQRDVLHLVFYEGCTLAEAAAVLNARLGTVRTHYERGKVALRKQLAAEDMT